MAPAHDPIETVHAELAYTRASDVSRDGNARGLLRARTLELVDASCADVCDMRSCTVRDWAVSAGFRPDLVRHGFDTVDLAPRTDLQATLERVRVAGRVEDADAAAIRRQLRGAHLRLGSGRRLRVIYIAPEGFIMRRGGPNRMRLERGGTLHGMNDHDAAVNVHADQDVYGTPVRQILRGAAPWLFHHDSPDGSNRRSPVFLLNLWVPLTQITRPLALMDGRTLDRRAHQLRYALPTDSFLERDADRRVNDIWTFLPDDAQQWYFSAEMDARRAYVFETLSTPHGSFVLPGEDRAEARYRALEAAIRAVEGHDRSALERATSPERRGGDPPGSTPAPLRRALATMDRRLDEARRLGPAGAGDADERAWIERAKGAMERVVRRSLEMRVVGIVTGCGTT